MWLFFFFFKQKTPYELRISDWSSDVCSSDLVPIVAQGLDKPVSARETSGKKRKSVFTRENPTDREAVYEADSPADCGAAHGARTGSGTGDTDVCGDRKSACRERGGTVV